MSRGRNEEERARVCPGVVRQTLASRNTYQRASASPEGGSAQYEGCGKFRCKTDPFPSFKYNVTVTAILSIYLRFFVEESPEVMHSQVGSGFCEGDRTVDDSRPRGSRDTRFHQTPCVVDIRCPMQIAAVNYGLPFQPTSNILAALAADKLNGLQVRKMPGRRVTR